MNEPLIINNWWRSSVQSFPSAFWADQHKMEVCRMQTLLARTTERQEEIWFRLGRAATLLESTLLDKVSIEEPKKVWELIALIHEATGVVDRNKKHYQWILSALAWQLADSPAIAGLLADRLYNEDKASQY